MIQSASIYNDRARDGDGGRLQPSALRQAARAKPLPVSFRAHARLAGGREPLWMTGLTTGMWLTSWREVALAAALAAIAFQTGETWAIGASRSEEHTSELQSR